MIKFLVCMLALVGLCSCSDQSTHTAASQNDEVKWKQTVAKVSPGIVNIFLDTAIPTDEGYNMSVQGTGFVVDAKRGIILTNRHLMSNSPLTAFASFINDEEISLTPLYRDPVHDFGFYQYDPTKLKHIQPHEFTLAPDRADIGREIRVIGNDAGQKISILSGTISRLDAPAPFYGWWKYSDFNTFYIQAASSTSGGSSGSPVIDIDGHVVALNAGGNSDSATSYYLPLLSSARALTKLQNNQTIQRGTLQVHFIKEAFAELKRLGLTADQETSFRNLDDTLTGLLVASVVIPGSDAEGHIEVGDILTHINQRSMTHFDNLEKILGEQIGQTVDVDLIRQGKAVQVKVSVDDLHQLQSRDYIRFDGGIFHDFSYHQARFYNRDIEGVFISNPSLAMRAAGIPRHSLLVEFNRKKVSDVAELRKEIENTKENEYIHLAYYKTDNVKKRLRSVIKMKNTWFVGKYCEEQPPEFIWQCSPLTQNERFIADNSAAIPPKPYTSNTINTVAKSLLRVRSTLPYSVQGYGPMYNNSRGIGIVVDAEKGLVMTDRATVPTAASDVELVFLDTVSIDAKIIHLHPNNNLVMLSYDPEQVTNLGIRSMPIHSRKLNNGDELDYVHFGYGEQLLKKSLTVGQVNTIALAHSWTANYRAHNIDVISASSNTKQQGILIDNEGRLAAFWAGFDNTNKDHRKTVFRGITAQEVAHYIDLVRDQSSIQSLYVELTSTSINLARKRGLSNAWLNTLNQQDSFNNRVFQVRNVSALSPAAKALSPGDIILAINSTPLTRIDQLPMLSNQGQLTLSVLSNGKEKQLHLDTMASPTQDLSKFIHWNGANLHLPSYAIAQQRGIERKGLVVNYVYYGSPSSRYKLRPNTIITHVNGEEISNINDFLQITQKYQNAETMTLTTYDMSFSKSIVTLKPEPQNWPGLLFENIDGIWKKTEL